MATMQFMRNQLVRFTYRLRRYGIVSLVLMVVACATRTPIPPTAVPLVQPPQVIVVTVTPRPTETPLPTITPFFDVVQLSGRWLLDINYQLRSSPFFDNVRYVGSFPLNVAPDGTLSGSGTFYTTVDQPPCSANVREGTPRPRRFLES